MVDWGLWPRAMRCVGIYTYHLFPFMPFIHTYNVNSPVKHLTSEVPNLQLADFAAPEGWASSHFIILRP